MIHPEERPSERTYVVLRWLRHAWADPPAEELTPLGTVRASACRPALLLGALAADGARDRAHGGSEPDAR